MGESGSRGFEIRVGEVMGAVGVRECGRALHEVDGVRVGSE